MVATLFFAAAAVVALFGGFLVLLGGQVLSRFFPINLIEASAILLFTIFSVGIITSLSRISDSIRAHTILGDAEWIEDDDDDFEEEDEPEMAREERQTEVIHKRANA